MGAYKFENANPPVMGGFRGPINKNPDCGCAAIRLAPAFLRPLVSRIVAPAKVSTVTEKDLHPEVDRVVGALLNLQEATARSKARNGKEVRVAFTKPARTGDDFAAEVAVAVGDASAFGGRLMVRDVWKRGRISFAHAVIGAIELLYLHLLETASRTGGEVDMRLGIVELAGRASSLDVVRDMVQQEIVLALAQQQQNDPGGGTCDPGPFDPLALYGTFPSSGFGYFHGLRAAMVEQPLTR